MEQTRHTTWNNKISSFFQKMGYVCILFLFIINTALTYYLYNPVTHDLIIRRSLQDIPKGYKLVPPPRNYTRRSRLSRGTCTCNIFAFYFFLDEPPPTINKKIFIPKLRNFTSFQKTNTAVMEVSNATHLTTKP